jgi:hypothetical protein
MAMKDKTLYIVGANLALLVLLAVAVPALMVSPGAPIDAHAELASDCFACHTPFIGSRPEKCIACHKVADIGLRTTKGRPIANEKKSTAFHQELIEEDCVACHSDHKGVKAFRPISQFSHGLVKPRLREQCDGCHRNPGDALHLPLKGNCAQCHTQEAWQPATFSHDDYFRFDRDHRTECETCHMEGDYTGYTCYGCHEHSRSKVREEHEEEGIRDYERCVECHRSGDEDEAKRIWRSKAFDSGRLQRFDGRKRHHDDDD